MGKLVQWKPWMTKQMLALIEESNKLRKIGDHIRYKIIKNYIIDNTSAEKKSNMGNRII